MSAHRRNPAPARAAAVFLLAGVWCGSVTLARDADYAPHSLTGTVKTVDPEKSEVRLLCGVGHALRVEVFHAGTGCRIRTAAREVKLGELKRGSIVVVRYREAPQRHEAASIETLGEPGAGARR